jgi:hypothetical protein
MIRPIHISGAAVAAFFLSALAAPGARAQDYEYGPGDSYGGPAEGQGQEPPIPPYVEGQPIAAQGGGYCYVGPHPVDTRVVPGPSFEEVQGQNIRPYAPVDLRLFSYRDGCYYFIGDPRDFGYVGQSYSYYGAHPVLDTYGGGWCFMMGGHYHMWAPWSPYFTVVGPWYYWYGAYDPFFWSYWPYYSFYYRSYYPNYYGGGRFYRGGGYRAAPPISRVPPTAWRGSSSGAGGGFRGTPPTSASAAAGSGWRGTPPTAASPAGGAGLRGTSPGGNVTAPFRSPAAPAPGAGWRGTAPSSTPSYSAPFRSAPSGGGFRMPGGGFRGGGRR